ncbi:MAG: hypothetical protein AB7U05_02585 [Mangrovibacterium sp.]
MATFYIKAEINYRAKSRHCVLVCFKVFAANTNQARTKATAHIDGWDGVSDFDILKVTTDFLELNVYYVSIRLKYSNGNFRDITLNLRAEDETEAVRYARSIVGRWNGVVLSEVQFVSR